MAARTSQPNRPSGDLSLLTLLDRVADVRGTDIAELPPVHNTIDGDLVSELLESDFPGSCSFTYAGCEIVITGDGMVQVRELGPSAC